MPTTSPGGLMGVTILVVDDEPDDGLFIRTVLEDAGASVLAAGDGDEALAMMRRHRPDLVTLDLEMPGKNGVDAFFEARSDPSISGIPICIVTGRPDLRRLIYDRAAARAPEGYLNKPISAETLLLDVRRILHLRRRAGADVSA